MRCLRMMKRAFADAAVPIFLGKPPEQARHIVVAVQFLDQLGREHTLSLDGAWLTLGEVLLATIHTVMQIVIGSLDNHHVLVRETLSQ